MKVINNLFFISILMLFLGVSAFGQLSDSFQILPRPKSVEVFVGKGLEYGELGSIQIGENIRKPVLGKILSLLPEKDKINSGRLILKLSDDERLSKSLEGYLLKISNGNVEITSRGEVGLFYGCQTLEQLLEDSRDLDIEIPACEIMDYPDYTYRSVHFDTKHHLDHISYYYDSIDRLARYKINSITWEFEDKLGYQSQPLVGAPQAISISEMAALAKYAKARNIEITPLVQGLGHATYILKHESYAYLREQESNRWAFCPLHEGTYQVLFDLYREAIQATPGSRYFHIGGDEVGGIGLCHRCKKTADEKGQFELGLYWMNRVCEFLVEMGRIPIFWGDMPFKHAGVWKTTRSDLDSPELWGIAYEKLESVIDRFPENGVFMNWNYTTCRQPGNERVLEWLTDNNLNVMISNGANSGPAALFPFDDRTGEMSDRGLVAIQSSLQLAFDKGIDGVLTAGWDDRSPHMETYWRGFIASAEFSWNTNHRNLEEYQTAYMQREYGPAASYTDLYLDLRDAALFWETSLVRSGNRMETKNALLKLPGIHHENEKNIEGRDVVYDDIVIDLPDIKYPGKWSKIYKDRVLEAERLYSLYESTSSQLDELAKVSIRNQYHWEVFSALNDFQMSAPKLILALAKCDVRSKSYRVSGIQDVKKALSDFEVSWKRLQKTYGKTRHLSSPINYVKDRYYHFASQREDLTWMIQVEELLHKHVSGWLEEISKM